MVPKWSENSPKMVPKLSQNDPKMVPRVLGRNHWSVSQPTARILWGPAPELQGLGSDEEPGKFLGKPRFPLKGSV